MNVLITGASGFLGKAIIKVLRENSDNVIFTLSRTAENYRISLEKEVPVFKNNFQTVIHAAGKAHSVPKTDFEKKQFYDINVLGTSNLLQGLEKSGLPKNFVYISSVSVYGVEEGSFLTEDAPLLAKDPYGESKILSEKIVREWCLTHNVVCTILRLPLLIGENAPGNLGAMFKAIAKGYYFNIDGGKANKSMVVAEDVANLIPTVAVIGGVYNLTDGEHPSFKQLSEAITYFYKKSKPKNIPFIFAKIMGVVGDFLGPNAPINSVKVKKITSVLTFDDSKARDLLNWNPQSVTEYIRKKINLKT